MKIQIPSSGGIFPIAANVLAEYVQKICGYEPEVVHTSSDQDDLIILGNDAENPATQELLLSRKVKSLSIRYSTDDYTITSVEDSSRAILLIAGGRPRALLYAIYHYLEACGCSYFWDGDVLPALAAMPLRGFDIHESPRFSYRGLRYFAHRSLNRFQAEHWDFAEWQKEIDWMLKKRLNLFMLRIGQDDLFQKAFPGIVTYPGYEVPESTPRSYNDRNLFWSLRYRGELRKKILRYARERDLMHPEDVGTTSHWYSQTPLEFLDKVKPDFLPQATDWYSNETERVWDVRQDKNLDNYFRLTETHIREYGSPELFHTIGLAERRCYAEHESNHQMKLYVYHRIIRKLRENYPLAPLLVGTWDFGMHWTPQEVQALVKELNPANTLILDYTSDTTDEANNFTTWGLQKKFPWIFGIFHAYEPANEIRGNYTQIERRLPLAADDPLCQGMVYWPECSHSDTLMLDYMATAAWNPDLAHVDEFLAGFCQRRYPNNSRQMLQIWKKVLPLARIIGWAGPKDEQQISAEFSDIIFQSLSLLTNTSAAVLAKARRGMGRLQDVIHRAPEVFRMLIPVVSKEMDDFTHRDVMDLARTGISRLQTYGFSKFLLLFEEWRNEQAEAEEVLRLLDSLRRCVELEAALLAAHTDYSLYDSLKLLERKHETNPNFEVTLKGNAEHWYCRSYISELFAGVYLPELQGYSEWIKAKLLTNDRSPLSKERAIVDLSNDVQNQFYETPLSELAPDHENALKQLPSTLEKLAQIAEEIVLLQRNDSMVNYMKEKENE